MKETCSGDVASDGRQVRRPAAAPDHKDVAGISFVTEDKDLVSLAKLANEPSFNDIEK